MSRQVTLVDEQNVKIGSADLIAAHTGEGKLHRAFSVYVFRKNGTEILIQRRAEGKMLWPLIWANTCCSHPFENESAEEAGSRRLNEELGFTCPLREAGQFVYRALDPAARGVEHEHVTMLRGDIDDATVKADPKEVAEWKWVGVEELREEMKKKPEEYAPWFHLGLEKIIN